MNNFHQSLDARGLNCPMPLLKMKQAVNKLESGQVLQVLTTDPGSLRDFDTWLEQAGHELLGREDRGDEYIFTIRKG